jgi:nitronate monooxygenase
MPLRTKLTEKLGISHPILLAPMGTASGGTLAKAVTDAGGFGIIGFGHGNQERIDQEFRLAGNARVGCGFITWSLARQPHLLARALEHKPQPSCSPSAMPDLLPRRSKTRAQR